MTFTIPGQPMDCTARLAIQARLNRGRPPSETEAHGAQHGEAHAREERAATAEEIGDRTIGKLAQRVGEHSQGGNLPQAQACRVGRQATGSELIDEEGKADREVGTTQVITRVSGDEEGQDDSVDVASAGIRSGDLSRCAEMGLDEREIVGEIGHAATGNLRGLVPGAQAQGRVAEGIGLEGATLRLVHAATLVLQGAATGGRELLCT